MGAALELFGAHSLNESGISTQEAVHKKHKADASQKAQEESPTQEGKGLIDR
jgi:hypothetical protein